MNAYNAIQASEISPANASLRQEFGEKGCTRLEIFVITRTGHFHQFENEQVCHHDNN
jgi:hypothetical protein